METTKRKITPETATDLNRAVKGDLVKITFPLVCGAEPQTIFALYAGVEKDRDKFVTGRPGSNAVQIILAQRNRNQYGWFSGATLDSTCEIIYVMPEDREYVTNVRALKEADLWEGL